MKGNDFGGSNSGGPYGGKDSCSDTAALHKSQRSLGPRLTSLVTFQVAMAQAAEAVAMALGDINTH